MPSFATIGRPTFSALTAKATPLFKGRALRRRMMMFREAGELLPHLPAAPGESLHAVMTGRYDLCILLAAILEHYGLSCPAMRIATLSFSRRNVTELAELLRSGKVGTLTLLCSEFFRDHNKAEFSEAKQQAKALSGRWRIASARSHAKVITADLGSRKLVIEGSANLRTNSNREQFMVVLDHGLHDWHAQWIDELVTNHERDKRSGAEATEAEEDAGE